MTAPSICSDTTEAVDLFEPQGLYLKPIARINVSVQLPQLKSPGKSISNWEVMEKVKGMVKPHQFVTLKVAKSTLDFIRFEGETENKALIKTLIDRLDGKTIKLVGFPDQLKVRAAEAKLNFPSRHDWDSFFRDAKNMNEMKFGERPDTIHFKELPCRWFANKKDENKDKPSEYILKKVMETFGEVRCVDIPMLDPYRREMSNKAGIQTFSFGQDITFEAFVQYKEYIGFVKAMTAFRGMKLLYKEGDGKAYTANSKIDFDRTKHLTDKNIRKRRIERDKLEQLEREREEKVRKEREEEERKKEEERKRLEEEEKERERKREEKLRKREERLQSREEKRRLKREERRRKEEERKMKLKIALEERKILIAQRKLETIRLLGELLCRVKVVKQQEELKQREKELEEEQKRRVEKEKQEKLRAVQKKLESEKRKKERLERQEKELRDKILKNVKLMEERKQEKEREFLRKKVAGQTRLKSAVIMKK
ncbi:A-kinase anchor protein 17A-like [Lingula anatina]|uniref:A-kinase anchor protein 17A n=1 Tax=Lingula anatina TaxID=7574 RepID=A0A1S3HV77_LINAN|nr:A-kinase anchor protein 17A [Lingula anatina]XP_013395032.1 A-kinase anchor protein 17A-like [Lingula anatina]|eukprot:XP_013389923.1 A-kinase anchor protein 17A [Lingula anatina]